VQQIHKNRLLIETVEKASSDVADRSMHIGLQQYTPLALGL